MSDLAVNDKGDVLVLEGGAWKPASIAENDKGERLAFDGKSWRPLPASRAPIGTEITITPTPRASGGTGVNGSPAMAAEIPPVEPTVGERLTRQLGMGSRAVGRGLAAIPGAPVDIVTALANATASGINLAGRTVGMDPGIKPVVEPIGGSESIKNLFGYLADRIGVPGNVPVEAQTGSENLIGKIIENATAFGVPAAGMTKLAGSGLQGGKTAAELNPLLKPYGEALDTAGKMAPGVKANYAAARPVLVDTAAGAGAGVGQYMAPDTPLGQLVGSLAGGLAGATGFNVATAPWATGKAVADYAAKDATVPGATRRIADQAGRTIQSATEDSKGAAAKIRTKDQAYRDAGISPPTAGLLSEDPGLVAIEKGVRNSPAQPKFVAADARTRQSAADTVADIGPNADPRIATDFADVKGAIKRGAAQTGVEQAEGVVGAAKAITKAEAGELAANVGAEASASTVIDQTVRGTLKDQRATKNKLYDEAKLAGEGVERDLASLKEAAAELRSNVSPLVPDGYVLPKQFADAIDKAEKSNFKDIAGLRPALSDAIGDATAKGNGAMVESLVKLKTAVEAEGKRVIDEAAKPGASPEVVALAEKLQAADTNYKTTYKPNFVEGEGGNFRQDIARDPTGANTQPSQTAKRFLATQESAADLKRIVDLAGSPKEAQQGVRDYLFAQVAKVATDGEKVSETRLNRWLAQNKGIIDQYPQVAQEMRDLQARVKENKVQGSASEAQLAKAKKGLNMTEREIEQSGLGLMMGKDPQSAIEAVFKSGDAERSMASLVKQMGGKDGKAPTALAFKRAVADWVEAKVTNQNPAATSEGSNPISLAKLAKVDDRYDKTLAQVFTPAEMSSLQMVRKAVTDLSRLSGVRATAGSNTAEDVRSGLNLVELIAKAQQGALKGGGTVRVVKLVLSNLGLIGEGRAAGDVLARAMHDPALAAHLLERPVTKQDRSLWNSRLNTLMGVAAAGRESGKE